MMKFADLHLHTVFSDGTYTPYELVCESKRAGLSAVAVADHDTVGGVRAAKEAAEAQDLEVLAGIELSAEYQGIEVHILGYLIDYEDSCLLEKLENLKQRRIERIYEMVSKLKGIGVTLEAQRVFDIAGKGTVGRLHVARALAKEGKVGSVSEAFQRYIGDKSPAYVLGFKFSPKDAIKLIRDSGGIAVLAHPYTIHDDELIYEFIGYGLMGLEVYYPEHSQSMVNFYLELAKKHNLLVTGGSDCHGSAKPDVKIGSIKIPYELIERLKEAKDRLRAL